MLTPAQLIALRAQLDSAYAGKSNGQAVAEINDPTGPNKVSGYEVDEISNTAAVSAVVASEFVALAAAAQRGWLMVTNLERIPVQNVAIRTLVADIWAAPTMTRANLVALQTRDGSHAEGLFGVRVSIDDVRAARRI